MRKALFLVCLVAPILLFSQQIQQHTYDSNGERIGFLEYKPSSYNPNGQTKYPVIIFLHGIGERGNGTTELNRVKNISIPHYIDNGNPMRFFWNGKWETFLVLSPQCPTKYGMWPVSYVDAMITYAEQNLNTDKKRIFLAGLSMGGGGIWKYASSSLAHANRLAAIATVCAPPTMTNACNIAKSNLPLWAFHATNDKTVNVSSIYDAINRINSCNPGTPAKKTVWPTGGHTVWDRAFDTEHTYQSPNVYEWFLAQGQQPAPVVNKKPIAKTANVITLNKPATFQLNGTASNDADGYIAQYSWRKISGPSGDIISNLTSSITNVIGIKTRGTYKYELKVTDNKGAWATTIITVNVINPAQNSNSPKPVNKPPIVKVGPDKTITLPQNSVWITGASSVDKDKGDYIASFNWKMVHGPSTYHIGNPRAGNTIVTNLKPGDYRFRLTVKDGKGLSAYDDVQIRVNAPPMVKAGDDKTITLPVNYVYLKGTRSVDPGGWISSFRWSQMNGPRQFTIVNPYSGSTVIRNLKAGVYVFRLIVKDGDGATAYDEVTVRVNKPYKNQINTMALAKSTIEPPSAIQPPASETIAVKETSKPVSDKDSAYFSTKMNIYPNPASGNINIICNTNRSGRAAITIYDFSGRLVKTISLVKDSQAITRNIDISSLKNGMYVIKINIDNLPVSSGRFIKQ